MVDPQRAEQNEGRPFLVQGKADDRKIRVAERQEREQERSSASNVIGWILLVAAGLTMVFSPADMRAGGHMIEWIGGAMGVIGLALVGAGYITRRRLEEEVGPRND